MLHRARRGDADEVRGFRHRIEHVAHEIAVLPMLLFPGGREHRTVSAPVGSRGTRKSLCVDGASSTLRFRCFVFVALILPVVVQLARRILISPAAEWNPPRNRGRNIVPYGT